MILPPSPNSSQKYRQPIMSVSFTNVNIACWVSSDVVCSSITWQSVIQTFASTQFTNWICPFWKLNAASTVNTVKKCTRVVQSEKRTFLNIIQGNNCHNQHDAVREIAMDRPLNRTHHFRQILVVLQRTHINASGVTSNTHLDHGFFSTKEKRIAQN